MYKMFLNKIFNYQESKRLQTPSILFKGHGKLTHLKVFNQWEQFRDYVNENYWLMYDISKILDDSIKEDVLDPPRYDLKEFYNWIHSDIHKYY